jgi:hypothetical protein
MSSGYVAMTKNQKLSHFEVRVLRQRQCRSHLKWWNAQLSTFDRPTSELALTRQESEPVPQACPLMDQNIRIIPVLLDKFVEGRSDLNQALFVLLPIHE